MSFFAPSKKLSDFNPHFTREDLVRRCRLLVIDDEKPGLIGDLSGFGFAVDHDPTGDDITNIEKNLYDLILLDFRRVGLRWGPDEGLSLLRHIKRVNPAPFILAYTSQNLPPTQSSEFYRLTDGTLYKDASIQESVAKIEDSLRESLNVERLWQATLKLTTKDATLHPELERKLVKALNKNKYDSIFDEIGKQTGESIKERLPGFILKKLIDLAVVAIMH